MYYIYMNSNGRCGYCSGRRGCSRRLDEFIFFLETAASIENLSVGSGEDTVIDRLPLHGSFASHKTVTNKLP